MRAILAAMALVLALPAAAQQPPAPSTPMIRPEKLTQVSPHVRVIPDESRGLVANIGFVVGTRAVLVVDTGLGPANGAAVAATAKRIAPGRKVWLVATHAHPEHDLGAQAFAGATLMRSDAQNAEKENDLRLAGVFAGRSPAIADLLKDAQFRPADVTFKQTHELDLGGVKVRLLALGPAHTPGDIAIWVAEDRVLFSGDLAMTAQPSIFPGSGASLATWKRALDAQEALKPAIVVPSHGPMGDVGYIKGYRDYLAEVADRTAKAKAGGANVETAVEAVTAAMAERYPDRGRLSGAVRMAYGP